MIRSPNAWVILALLALSLCACGDDSSQQTFATCGNGSIDAGETCDDGNNVDSDDCTQICQPARCGDGVRQAGVEACDSADVGSVTCAELGFEGRFPGCHADCTIDVSRCGPALPPTATPASTATVTATGTATVPAPATATPTATPPPCGDGLLRRPSETCEDCPQDCTPQPCDPNSGTVSVAIGVTLPDAVISSMRVVVGYRTSVLNLPATGLTERIQRAPGVIVGQLSSNGYELQTLAGHTPSLISGEIFTVRFDRCTGSPPPTDDDLSCVVTACGNASDCTCSATVVQ